MTPEQELLALWDAAAGRDRWQREEALLHAAGVASDALSVRHAALLGLRARLLGPALALRAACPQCAAEVEFEVDVTRLAAPNDSSAEPWHELEHDRRRIAFRLPRADDLRACAGHVDRAGFARALLARCLREPAALDDAALEAVAARMEALEPGASLSFALDCPACGSGWQAPLDVGDTVWRELQAQAERVLFEVDALARRYGWTEGEVLALPPLRRAAYLQLAEAAA